jgi:phage-related protein
MGGWEKVGKIVGGAIAVLVAPLAVLVGGVIYAYTHFQAFHDIIDRVVQFITGTVVPAVQRMAASVMVEIGALAAWWNAHWDAIQEAVGHVWVAIQAIVDTALNLISQAWDAWGGRFMSIVSAVWSQIQAYVQAAIAVVRGIIQLVIDLINGDWGKAWNDILGILSAVWELIKSTVQNALTIVQNLLGVALDALWKAMQAGWDVILGVVNVAWEGIKSVAGAAMTWLGDRLHDLFVELPGKLLDVVTNVGVAVIGFIISGLTAAWDAYWRFTEKLHDFFAELPAKILDGITAVGTFIVTNLWSGLTTAWDTVWDLEKKLGDALRGAADAMVSVASELGSKIVNAIVDGIKSGPSVIIDAIKSLIPGSGVLGDVGNKVSGWLGFADGGVVPGAIGAPVPALVHGGEVILNPQQQARVRGMIAGGVGSSGGDVYNVSVTLDAKNVKDWTDVVNIIKGAAVAQRAGRRS